MTIFAEQNTRTMANIRILHLDGRMVAIFNKGIWHRLEGVTNTEFGTALQQGDVEELSQKPEVTNGELVSFAVTIGACLVLLMCGMLLFNVGC